MADNANDPVVDKTTPEGENQDELNSILEALDKDDTVVEDHKNDPAPSDDKNNQPFKKVGNHVFQTEADYDTWALKQDGEVSRLTGELAKATAAAKATPSPKTEADIKSIMMQIKVSTFFEANPDAVEHRDVIAALIRSGKAKSLDEAKTMALRAVGVEAKKEDNTADIKNILKAGGSEGVGAGSYNTQEQVKGTSDFADNALLGKLN